LTDLRLGSEILELDDALVFAGAAAQLAVAIDNVWVRSIGQRFPS
jgi:hypothetical protein